MTLGNKTELLAREYLIKQGIVKEENLLRHYPDFYDFETKRFYEVKLLTGIPKGTKKGPWGRGCPRIQFQKAQRYSFSKLNPLILIFKPNETKPFMVIEYNELMARDRRTLPFTIRHSLENNRVHF